MIDLFRELQPFDHVIWDLNGTLVDDAHVCVEAVRPLLREHGLREIDLQDYRKAFRFPVMEYYADLGFRVSPDQFREMSHRFHDHYHRGLETAGLFEGTRELLAAVRESGKKQSILTAAWREDLNQILARYDLAAYFDHLFALEHREADSKVQRGHDLMREAGVAPSRTVLCGDTLHDLDVGEALGVEVILLTQGHMDEERLRARHHRVVARIPRSV